MYTRSVNIEQSSRWSEINNPRFYFVRATTVVWEELDKEEIDARDWGYIPLIFPLAGEDFIVSKKVGRHTALVIWDVKNNKHVTGYTEPITVNEARKTVHSFQIPLEMYDIKQLFEFNLEFRNAGTLPAKHVIPRVFASLDDQSEVKVLGGPEVIDEIPGGFAYLITPGLFLSIEHPFPDKIRVRVEFQFQGQRGETTSETILNYDSKYNVWRRIK